MNSPIGSSHEDRQSKFYETVVRVCTKYFLDKYQLQLRCRPVSWTWYMFGASMEWDSGELVIVCSDIEGSRLDAKVVVHESGRECKIVLDSCIEVFRSQRSLPLFCVNIDETSDYSSGVMNVVDIIETVLGDLPHVNCRIIESVKAQYKTHPGEKM